MTLPPLNFSENSSDLVPPFVPYLIPNNYFCFAIENYFSSRDGGQRFEETHSCAPNARQLGPKTWKKNFNLIHTLNKKMYLPITRDTASHNSYHR